MVWYFGIESLLMKFLKSMESLIKWEVLLMMLFNMLEKNLDNMYKGYCMLEMTGFNEILFLCN